jgi:hypothetical protein
MCLVVTVRAPATGRAALAAAAAALPSDSLHVELAPAPDHAPRWPWARAREAEAVISEAGGCACSLLAEDADWNAESWAMRPEVREALARTLEKISSSVPDGTIVEALWVGDRSTHERVVTPTELARIARANALGTRTR